MVSRLFSCSLILLVLDHGVGSSPVVVERRERNAVVKETDEVVGDSGEAMVDKGNKGKQPVAKETEEEYQDFEVISDTDREAADQAMTKEILTFAGYTLLVVAGSIFTIICFLMDPRACLVAFASGSPCCLVFPCYRNLMQYTDPAKLIKANVNVYVPGIYVEEGGKLKQYPPTPDEMDCLHELVAEFMSFE